MDVDTRIFGYTDGMQVHPQEDDIVLCPSDGAKYFEANPNEWRIMRAYDRPQFLNHKCDNCQKMIFPIGEDVSDPRLEVYAEYLETLEF